MQDTSLQLKEQPVSKLLWQFSIPAIVGLLVTAFYNIVGRIFVGQGVHPLGISGISVAFPLIMVLMAFGMLVGVGASVQISLYLGQGKKTEAERILGHALVLSVITSLVVGLGSLPYVDTLLRLFGASEEVLPYARDYIVILLIGATAQNVGFGLNNIIRAEGNPKTAMVTMLLGALVNIILTPLFILVLHMGMQGAALATVLAQTASSIWVVGYFLGRRSFLKLKLSNLYLRRSTVINIFYIGMSPFAMQLAASLVTIIINNSLVKYGGDLAVGAMGIIASLGMMIFMPIFGVNQGAQPIIGFNYGARQFDRVKETLQISLYVAIAICTVGFIIVQVFAESLIAMFSPDPNLIQIGALGLRIDLAVLPIIGIQIVGASYFQAVGKPKISLLLSLSRQVILLIPLLLILPRFFNLIGVWVAMPVADFISAMLTLFFLAAEAKYLRQEQATLVTAK